VAIGISKTRVAELWRYPVKSMAGELCESFRCSVRGVDGDRLFAIRDSLGKFGSGKNTRRFRKIDNLLEFASHYVNGVVQVRFPQGAVYSGDAPEIHSALTVALGQPVELVREADISHLDAEPVHIVTSASLQWLREALPGVQIDARRFRPNVFIDAPGVGPIEQAWVGRCVRIGAVVFRVTAATERCGMVALAQGDLPLEPSILRCITQQASLTFGVYAKVVDPGVIRKNDAVLLEGES